MKQNIFRNLVTVLALASVTQLASANCIPETPEANAVLAAQLNLQSLDNWFSTEFSLRGWNASRGTSAPTDTNLEYNKLMLGAVLLAAGVNNEQPEVWQNPVSGNFEYRPLQIYLNPAFHRSADEWGWLISDKPYRVCDHLNSDNGNFDCEKEGKWPSRRYRKFGKKTTTRIADVVPADMILANPTIYTVNSPASYENRSNTDRLNYYCPNFQTPNGDVDEFSAINAAEALIVQNFEAFRRGQRRTEKRRLKEMGIFQFGGNGHQQSALVRSAADTNIGQLQVNERMLCDLTLAHQAWVPLMIVELANVRSNSRMAERKYTIDGSPGQPSPFTCGLSKELLKLKPGVDVCSNGQLRCDTSNDCPTSGTYYCSDACCVLDDSDDGGIIR